MRAHMGTTIDDNLVVHAGNINVIQDKLTESGLSLAIDPVYGFYNGGLVDVGYADTTMKFVEINTSGDMVYGAGEFRMEKAGMYYVELHASIQVEDSTYRIFCTKNQETMPSQLYPDSFIAQGYKNTTPTSAPIVVKCLVRCEPGDVLRFWGQGPGSSVTGDPYNNLIIERIGL